MAALWALTGALDPRRAVDSKVSDVVNDESKVRRMIQTLKSRVQGTALTLLVQRRLLV